MNQNNMQKVIPAENRGSEKISNSGGGLIKVVDQVCFPFIRLDVTLCRDSIHCPFESGLSPLSVVLLEAGK